MKRSKKERFIIGIDEAGRGPLAGPVTVGAFGAYEKMGNWLLKNIFNNKLRDSKKLSSKKREEIYKKLCMLKNEGRIFFAVSHISNKIIDKKGISYATKLGIIGCLKKLEHETATNKGAPCWLRKCGVIRLDGSLKAPEEYKNQKTIIKGDEKDVFIACASIVAKVSRDRLMTRLGSTLPLYAFQIHKGYGTSLHRFILQKNGLSPLHRRSFCKNLTDFLK